MSDFEWVQLGKVAAITMGQSPDSETYIDDDRYIPFLQGCGDFTGSYPETDVFCTSPGKVAKEGSLLVSVRAPVGTTNVADKDYCIGRGLAAVKSNIVSAIYLREAFTISASFLHRRAQGSTFDAICAKDLSEMKISMPKNRRVGEKVTDIIQCLNSELDATQALIDKYTAIKQGMMADLFSRGIDPETKTLRPTFEEAPELYKKTPLGMLPKEWDVKTLGDISEKITSGSRDWAKFYSSEGDLFVRISNLTREHVNFRWNSVKYVNIGGGSEGERTQLQPGDILISITADLGIVGVVPEDMGRAYINQHTALIRLSTDGENARFIGNYLSSRCGQGQFEKNNDSGAKAGINLPTIASFRCPIPKEKEQILIASKIDTLDEVIADLKREKSKSISVKRGLMQDLLTGKVSVPV
ncbi:restriction endonuclease subunit S [Aliiglaciecola sp. LCG003]|uniref:restriction endonuclease subunit S n=1 Tax=Aliiglaciecola sp. LCG003 TaxID=3053655 RepID=UPI0025727F85|nr:restriction endonuclease subunit S [Aliiglaciecola sp. LCG003]WJG09398.1 restriction endonuclease subunit S [Aliiglaciecola sp. LCG003]